MSDSLSPSSEPTTPDDPVDAAPAPAPVAESAPPSHEHDPEKVAAAAEPVPVETPVPEEAFAPPEPVASHEEEAPTAETAEPEEDAPAPRPVGERSKAKGSEEARARALPRLASGLPRGAAEHVEAIVMALEKGLEPAFLGRFRRELTGGLDERTLLEVRDAWRRIRAEEERRAALRELLRSRGALDANLEERLGRANDVPSMEDVAAPWLPVTAGRATVARGLGLQGLADGIRHAKESTALSDLAKPFLKEGGEPSSLDGALAGARDILAETMALDAVLRGRLRELFRRESVISVALRGEKKGDAGRHAPLVGFAAPAGRVPPLKLLAIRRGERERVLSTNVEPPEAKAIGFVHDAVSSVVGDEHPHMGFLRAAAEDGYRRILKPLLSSEQRAEMKTRADEMALETYERSLRNLLLGPVGGAKKVLGVQPDVTGGHRVGAVDEQGRAVYFGRLPHEATAGRPVVVAALKDLLSTHAIDVVAVGTSNGRREVLDVVAATLVEFDRPIVVTEIHDGGTRAIEAAAVARPVKTDTGIEIAPEFTGALSIARRFQDPLAEYVRLDPKSLGLGPNLHDVHQGRLKERLDDVITSCVAHVGVDASSADEHLLGHLPGFDGGKAKAYVAWRASGGALSGKAALGAVPGVGLAAAEQAVGFLRVATAGDPRDRTQLHPEQFGLVEEMAAQVETDVSGLFRDGRLRARVDLGRLARPEAPMPLLKQVLWQATAGLADPRPAFAVPTKPPSDVTLQSLRPGLVLEGRVTRAVPFGVFVDVGLGAEALVPLPHVGDRPGIDPATVAPVGAVIQARVLEIDLAKKRLTLSMRSERDLGFTRARFDERRGTPRPMGGDRGPGGPPRGDRPPMRGSREGGGGPPRGPGGPGAAPGGSGGQPGGPGASPGGPGGPPGGFGGPPRGPGGPPRGPGGPPRRDEGRPGGGRPERGGTRDRPAAAGAGTDRRAGGAVGASRPSSGFGRGGGGGGGGGGRDRDGGRRFERDDPGAPRRISLPMEAGSGSEQPAQEEALTPEQLLARKLEELKRKLARPD